MSDFRCEWQALHGPRCSHQCNECKDNDTPPEPRMTSERQDVNRQCLAESLQTLAHAIDESYAPDVLASMNEAYRHLTIAMTLYDNPLRATPRAVPDETRAVDAAKANAIAVRLSAFARELGRDHPRYITLLNAILVIEARTAHPPRAGEVTEEAKLREALERIATLTYSEDANERVRLMRKDARSALGRPS